MLTRFFVFAGFAVFGFALAACAGSSTGSRFQPATDDISRSSDTFTVLHDFQGGPDDGGSMEGVSRGPDGALFGATIYGGHIRPRDCKLAGCGTIFEYAGSTEQLAYRFLPQPDGQRPAGGLVSHNGVLYGAAQGGAYNYGMIFSLRRNANGNWVETKLYDFKGPPDGSNVEGVLYVSPRGVLVGTTFMGGSQTSCFFQNDGCGAVFELQPPAKPSGSWRESILHSFGGKGDGAAPEPTLVREGGAFYGTTDYGGTSTQCSSVQGCGTIYKLTPTTSGAKERVEYSFNTKPSSNDGEFPWGLADGGDGNLYGTTTYGGGLGGAVCDFEQGIDGCGTFYSFPLKPSKNAHDTILYAFTGGADGAQPNNFAGSAASGFYGVALNGGSKACNTYSGCGTIFSIARSKSSWNQTPLYTFTGSSDGFNPSGPLVLSGSTLYGTAQGDVGRRCLAGCGVLYELNLAGALRR
jgi:hypothetical protein